METVGFTVFCLAVAGAIYWSLLYDDRLSEDDNGLFPEKTPNDQQMPSDN